MASFNLNYLPKVHLPKVKFPPFTMGVTFQMCVGGDVYPTADIGNGERKEGPASTAVRLKLTLDAWPPIHSLLDFQLHVKFFSSLEI